METTEKPKGEMATLVEGLVKSINKEAAKGDPIPIPPATAKTIANLVEQLADLCDLKQRQLELEKQLRHSLAKMVLYISAGCLLGYLFKIFGF